MVVLGVSGLPEAANAVEGVGEKDKEVDGAKSKVAPPCLKKGDSGVSRVHRFPTCSDVVTAYGEAGTEPWMEKLNLIGRQGKRKAEGKPHATLPNKRTTYLSQALAWK